MDESFTIDEFAPVVENLAELLLQARSAGQCAENLSPRSYTAHQSRGYEAWRAAREAIAA